MAPRGGLSQGRSTVNRSGAGFEMRIAWEAAISLSDHYVNLFMRMSVTKVIANASNAA